MRVRQAPTISWQEAPNIISSEDLAKILGCGIATARNKFDETNFPIIKCLGNLKKADKEAVRYIFKEENIWNIGQKLFQIRYRKKF